MNKRQIVILTGLLVIISMIPSIYAAQDEIQIPSWIKIIAGAWFNDQLTDSEFSEAMQWMVQSNIIILDNSQLDRISLSDQEKKLYELDIENKNSTIMTLQQKNAKLVIQITELEDSEKKWKDNHSKVKNDFQKYKDDYPLKVGNIGGELVNADTVRDLIEKEEKARNAFDLLVAEFEQYKKEHP